MIELYKKKCVEVVMTQNIALKNTIDGFEDKRLAMYVVCCHVDKLVTESIPASKYDVVIQAGAALTDKRVCPVNDLDDCDTNISDRNQRYSEMTAMYWAGQNIVTDYIGITHYRRRILISDEELSQRMDEGFDIITTVPCRIDDKIKANYIGAYYTSDWNLFMDIMDEYAPEDRELADELFDKDTLHPGNMGIYSAEIYDEYCKWMFPMLDAFHKRSPWKTDLYQRRDVGFIGERLTTLFVEKMKRAGKKVLEYPFKDYRSNEWVPEAECELSDFDAVISACDKYYLKDDISKSRRLVAGALNNGGVKDVRIRDRALLFKAGIDEQKELPVTMFEYLPVQWKKDLNTLLSAYQGLGNIINALNVNPTNEIVAMFREFISATGFSSIVIKSQCKNQNIIDESAVKRILSYIN